MKSALVTALCIYLAIAGGVLILLAGFTVGSDGAVAEAGMLPTSARVAARAAVAAMMRFIADPFCGYEPRPRS